MQSVRHARSSSRQDDKAEEAAEPTERLVREPTESNQEIDDLLDDIDDVLSEIGNPEQWVREYVQKGGQ